MRGYAAVIDRMPTLLEMKDELRVCKDMRGKSRVSAGIQQLWNLGLACI